MARTKTAENRLRRAFKLLAAGKHDQAKELLHGLPPLKSLTERAAFVRLHRDLGAPLIDEEVRLDVDLARASVGADAVFDRAKAFCLLDRPEALEAAEAAAEFAGTDREPLMLLLKIHLDAGQPTAATDAILNVANRQTQPGGLLLAAAKVLGQSGHKDQAIRLLEAAEPHQQDNLAEFEFVAAGIRGRTPSGTEQADMASAIFDKFAYDYDKVLASIDYSAPDMIAALLKQMPIKRMRRLSVLDAGCGTGLCAKLLKPYAKTLSGADISVPMLEKAKKRKLYDTLTRSDLNAPATIPAGPFDLIVMADVLIYFGDLSPVLAALAQRLTPGGWLLLTVEDGGALPPPGYTLGPSGRYKHSEAHIADALSAAGLGRTKHKISETLRHEFGMPIEGLAVAAQKPMLAI